MVSDEGEGVRGGRGYNRKSVPPVLYSLTYEPRLLLRTVWVESSCKHVIRAVVCVGVSVHS